MTIDPNIALRAYNAKDIMGMMQEQEMNKQKIESQKADNALNPARQRLMNAQASGAEAGTEAKELETAAARLSMGMELLSAAVDQPSWERSMSIAEQNGMDVRQFKAMPFSPDIKNQLGQMLMTHKQRLDEAMNTRKQGEIERHNKASEESNMIRAQKVSGSGGSSVYAQRKADLSAAEDMIYEAEEIINDENSTPEEIEEAKELRAMGSRLYNQVIVASRRDELTRNTSGEIIPDPARIDAAAEKKRREKLSEMSAEGKLPENIEKGMGSTKVQDAVKSLISLHKQKFELGAHVSEGAGFLENIGAQAKSLASEVPVVGAAAFPKIAGVRSRMQSEIVNLLNSIRAQNNLSARAMDSNRELEFYKSQVDNPEFTVEAAEAALTRVVETSQRMGDIFRKYPELSKAVEEGKAGAKEALEKMLYGGGDYKDAGSPAPAPASGGGWKIEPMD